jgi:XTP/dITP diphosphohydrolase
VDDPRGSEGFGYDPHFYSSELSKTFGEATVTEKQEVSHRGRAFRKLVAALRERGGVL